MKYRTFGQLDWQPSVLGFGVMRLPVIDDDPAKIDEPEATRMIRHAIDHGVNYVDTAYPYHGGNSERFLGQALQGGYREKVKLATKMPCWLIETSADFDKYLDEQLEKLGTEHIDFYLLHGLNEGRWRKMRDLGVREWSEKPIRDGRIGYLGFSFHDTYQVFKEIVDKHDWTFCQIQYNYMDVEYQAGAEGLRYAASKGLAVVIMEPLLGGNLVDPPPRIQAYWDMAPQKRTPADWALQWLWNQPEVSVVLSGMSTMQHVEENVASASVSAINILTEDELALADRVRQQYQQLRPIPCTQCRYCMPCPNGVDIPRNFRLYNDGVMYENPDRSRRIYGWLSRDEGVGADACNQCHECEDDCPQNIAISDWMPVIHEVLGEGAPYP
jgi:predicted aldo/keto reductase-like oxidoreductase